MPLRTSLFVGVPGSGLPPGQYDHGSFVSFFHIAELIPISPLKPSTSGTNGSN